MNSLFSSFFKFLKMLLDLQFLENGDELEFNFTKEGCFFRINNNQLKGVKVHQASTSGFTIENRNVHKELSKKFMYDVNVVEHEDGWFKITE